MQAVARRIISLARSARLDSAVTAAKVPSASWHVSGPVDVLGYGFSWLFVLVPMALAGDEHRVDYPLLYLLILALTETHRHFTYPYVYLDRQVFERHPLRFSAAPALLMGLWPASVALEVRGAQLALPFAALLVAGVIATFWVCQRDATRAAARPGAWRAGAIALLMAAGYVAQRWWPTRLGMIPAVALLNGFAVAAGLWNIWHVYMQKYGILRMYNAKRGAGPAVPGWVDRLILVGWLPLYLFALGPRWFAYVLAHFARGRVLLGPLFAGFERAASLLWLPSALLVAFALGNWLRWEWRTSRLRHAPRLWMFAGTALLSAAFLAFHPLKVYLAYAFSHAVEYMIFVWAFQRRRYRRPHAHRPLLGRLVSHPWLLYVVPALVLSIATIYLKYYGRWWIAEAGAPAFLSIPTHVWFKHYTVYQSMIHFYFDGFLWKMRLPIVQQDL